MNTQQKEKKSKKKFTIEPKGIRGAVAKSMIMRTQLKATTD